MSDTPKNDTYKRILDASERLFAQRGYSSVTLRDIANAVDMKHASLYYYVPGGKESLFVKVMERSFERHQRGISDVISNAGVSLRQQLYAVSEWFVTQPAMDISRIYQGDRPSLSEDELQRLMSLGYDALRLPIVAMLEQANQSETIELEDFDLAAMAFISAVQSVNNIPVNLSVQQRKDIGHKVVDMLLDGWRKR